MVLILLLLVLLTRYTRQQSKQKYLKAFPWVGVNKKEFFGTIRGAARSLNCAAQYSLEGYTEVSHMHDDILNQS